MPDPREELAKLASTAAVDLEPLIDQAASELGLEGEHKKERVGALLARAWMDGAQAGQDEMIRQTRAQGVAVEEQVLRPDDDA